MTKYLMKKKIFILALFVFIFTFFYIELIQKYHFQILTVFKAVDNDVTMRLYQNHSVFKLRLDNSKSFFEKNPKYEMPIINDKFLPVCPNTFEDLYKGRGTIS